MVSQEPGSMPAALAEPGRKTGDSAYRAGIQELSRMDNIHRLSNNAKQAWQRGYDLAHPRHMPARSGKNPKYGEGAREAEMARAVVLSCRLEVKSTSVRPPVALHREIRPRSRAA